MSGNVVVAVDEVSRSEVESILGATEWTQLRNNRWVATYELNSEEAALKTVADLRDAQYVAVAGPPDSARAVAWKKWNSPIPVGQSTEVCFPWVASNAELVIEIDPGVGFGRGDHPSTRLLLEELASRISGGESVLDVGCGSGILAIAAVRFGAARAIGIDINEAGLLAAAANARRNEVTDITHFAPTKLDQLTQKFDVVIANIHDQTLRELASDLVARLKPTGWLGLSGVSRGQISRLVAAFPEVEFEPVKEMQEWNALIGHLIIE